MSVFFCIEVDHSLENMLFPLTFMNQLLWLDFAQASGDISGNGSVQEYEGIPETQEELVPSHLLVRVCLLDLFTLPFRFNITFSDSKV